MEQVKKFFETLRTDPKAKELLAQIKSEGEADELEILAKVAQKLGFSLTAEEIAQGLEALSQLQDDLTSKAEGAISTLDIEDLEKVAGGASSCPPNLRRKIDSLIDMDMDSAADDNRCSKAPRYIDKIFDDGTDIVKKCRPATTKSPL